MDLNLRTLFTRKSKRNPHLKALPYESARECEPPIRGSLPVAGNGPDIRDQLQRAKDRRDAKLRVADDAAPPPIIPRERRVTDTRNKRRESATPARPTTAPDDHASSPAPAAFTGGRTRSGYTTNSSPESLRRASERRVLAYANRSRSYDVVNHAAEHAHAGHSGKQSHIDLLDAFSITSRQSRNSSSHGRIIASGSRDFGEEVADRNLTTEAKWEHTEATHAYKRKQRYKKTMRIQDYASSSSDDENARAATSRMPQTPSKGVRSWVAAHDGSRDDIPRPAFSELSSQVVLDGKHRAIRASASASFQTRSHSNNLIHVDSNPSVARSHSAATPRRTSISNKHDDDTNAPNATTSGPSSSKSFSSARKRDELRSCPSPSTIGDQRSRHLRTPPPVATASSSPVSRISSATAASRHTDNHRRSRRTSLNSTKSVGNKSDRIDDGGLNTLNVPRSKYSEAYINRRPTRAPTAADDTPAPYVDSPTLPAFPSLQPVAHQSAGEEYHRLPRSASPPSVPRFASQRIRNYYSSTLPTPPMSPTIGPDPPVSSRQSIDNDLHAAPSARSRGNSASYSLFPPASTSPPSRNSKSLNQSFDQYLEGTSLAQDDTSSSRTPSKAMKGRDLVVEGASERPSLEGIVDLRNTVDTEVTTRQAPAVVHEKVNPIVHHEVQEVVTREVHTHDVFHRVQPVIDVEVLPTKHFVPDPRNPGSLKEIPASAVPGRQNNWSVQVNRDVKDLAASPVPSTPANLHHAHDRREPVLSSKRTYTTPEGHPKTEYVWRHPPVLDMDAYRAGETKGLTMNCLNNDTHATRASNVEDRYSSSIEGGDRRSAAGEESLLFDDRGYGLDGGMLPGLHEKNPASPTTQAARSQGRGASGSATHGKGLRREERNIAHLDGSTEDSDDLGGQELEHVTEGMNRLGVNGRA